LVARNFPFVRLPAPATGGGRLPHPPINRKDIQTDVFFVFIITVKAVIFLFAKIYSEHCGSICAPAQIGFERRLLAYYIFILPFSTFAALISLHCSR